MPKNKVKKNRPKKRIKHRIKGSNPWNLLLTLVLSATPLEEVTNFEVFLYEL